MRLFRALGTIVSRKFGHWPISHKVRGNTVTMIKVVSSMFKKHKLFFINVGSYRDILV